MVGSYLNIIVVDATLDLNILATDGSVLKQSNLYNLCAEVTCGNN